MPGMYMLRNEPFNADTALNERYIAFNAHFNTRRAFRAHSLAWDTQRSISITCLNYSRREKVDAFAG